VVSSFSSVLRASLWLASRFDQLNAFLSVLRFISTPAATPINRFCLIFIALASAGKGSSFAAGFEAAWCADRRARAG
jgi:hypothetical protein